MMSTLPDATLPALAQVHQRLGELLFGQGDQAAAYAVPGLWLDPAGPATRRQVNPLRFFLDTIEAIAQQPAQPLVVGPAGGGWSQNAVAYNLFPRAAAAFDHDGDGTLALPLNSQGWRETGTFLKCIALLPWLRWLGINTVYLLPVTAVGKDGHKGNLGSPYAIRNPYRLDDNLGEPRLDLGVETEFKAFVEAAHHLGMRVVLEFVFRTAARDADWVAEHPEWFYWIDDRVPARQPGMSPADATLAYGAPIFSPEELAFIFAEANEGRFDRLPPPPALPETEAPAPGAQYVSLRDLCQLPLPEQIKAFRPLIPNLLLTTCEIDEQSLRDRHGDFALRLATNANSAMIELTIWRQRGDQDPALLLHFGETSNGQLQIYLVVVNNLDAERFDGTETIAPAADG